MFDYSPQELATVDQTLEPLLARASDQAAETEQLAMDVTRLLSVQAGQLAVCAKQPFFLRLFRHFKGPSLTPAAVQVGVLYEMQRIGWRYLQILNERDLMLAHAMITVKNNLLTLAVQETETREMLTDMAHRIADRFERLEETVGRLETQQNIHSWLLTLDTFDYPDEYPEKLRLLKIIQDFLQLKSSGWNIMEIKYLQKALKEVGLPWREEISLADFIDDLIEEIDSHGFETYQQVLTLNREQCSIPHGFMLEHIASPSHKSQYKIVQHYDVSSETLDILTEQLAISKKDAMKRVLRGFIEKEGIDTRLTIPLRDLAVELLGCHGLAVQLFRAAAPSAATPATGSVSESLPKPTSKPAPNPAALIAGRYEKTANGQEVIDHQTGLIWRADIERRAAEIGEKGFIFKETETKRQADAFTFDEAQARAKEVAQQTGLPWRVPTVDELASLVDRSRSEPASAFPDMPPIRFWSSSPYAGGTSSAWDVYFDDGDVGYYSRNLTFAVRLVRGG
ncbi:MAG: DUF1566 domain-containing protein [Methylococcaceae bacterium]